MAESNTHKNDERTVHCPVDGCDATPLARGAHLHVLRTSGNGHGENGEIPEGITFDDLETAGKREVSMDYPEHRQTEGVKRLCPYCEKPFRGKEGVLIHLGMQAGRGSHPDDAKESYDGEEFPIAHVDEHDNVIEVVDDAELLPTTERRLSESKRENYADAVEQLHNSGLLTDRQKEQARELLNLD